MKLTTSGKDLELVVAERCARAIETIGRCKGQHYQTSLDQGEIGRVLRYLADRFNAKLET